MYIEDYALTSFYDQWLLTNHPIYSSITSTGVLWNACDYEQIYPLSLITHLGS